MLGPHTQTADTSTKSALMGLSPMARAEQAHPRQKQRLPSVASSHAESVTELRMCVTFRGGAPTHGLWGEDGECESGSSAGGSSD